MPIENLQAFYKKFYRPDNAILMVTGKFETDKTLALIEKKFAGIKNPNTPLRDIPTIEPAQDGEKRVDLHPRSVTENLFYVDSGHTGKRRLYAITKNESSA